jgi:pimeloyl-ACP methyl ester carboxylesterase
MKRIFYFLLFLSLIVLAIDSYGQKGLASQSGILFDLDKLSTDCYYYGKFRDSIYYVKFDKLQSGYAEGSYFVVGNFLYADVHSFSISKKRKTYLLKFENDTYEIKPDIIVRSSSVIGKFGLNDKFLKIFNRFNWSDYLEFKKYVHEIPKRYPHRYQDSIFEVDVKSDIIYGNAEGYWDSYPVETETYFQIIEKGLLSTVTKKNLELKMDIYTPKGDSLKHRPMIMFIHGGGFYIGDKKTEAMVEWCKYFAARGYVTVSINYRLGYKFIGPSVERAGYRGLQDAHAAMRFLVKNKDIYGINTNLLFVGGTSAGGVTSLNLVFMRNKNRPEASRNSLFYSDMGDIESSTNGIKGIFKIVAVVNMWGAVNDLEILKNSKTSIISFHGDADKVVPINYDYPFQDIKGNFSSVILNKMYGSLPIHIKAKEIGLREELHIFEAASHSPHVDENDHLNENFNFISEHVRDFLIEEVYPKECKIESIPITPFNRAMPYYKISCEECSNISWSAEGGVITGKKNNSVRVTWFKNVRKHKLVLSGLYSDGTGFYDEYEF